MAEKQYIVRNPRGIAKGVHVCRSETKAFYEGDTAKASDFPADGLQWLVGKGILEEVSGG